MPTVNRYIFSLLTFCLTFAPVKSQYSIESLDQQDIIIHWQQNAWSVKKITCDQGKVSSYIHSDSLFFHLSELLPATLVNLSVTFEISGQESIKTIPFITKSASSGKIDVYFNLPVNPAFQKSDYTPAGTTYSDVQSALKTVIRAAKKTIDLAAYNTNEIFLVNELIDASNRGVRIRVITDDETTNSGWSGSVPFPILKGNLGPGLMHNKFLLVDQESQNDALVVTGSMNFTTNQMRKDPNHLLFIQDQSLAMAYTIEFDEMWGGSGDLPNLQVSRFGSQKIKNTPKDFVIGDIPVELFFSPSDGTTQGIIDEVKNSKNQILLALMIFTNWELRDEVKEKTIIGVDTRWIVDDDISSSSVMNTLTQAGATIKVHSNPDIFHHKYAIIDEVSANPVIITGSHNWTFAAETVNDENTLILHDSRLANIFRQEFEARWSDLISASSDVNTSIDYAPYPNPNHGLLYIGDQNQKPSLYNSLGQLMQTTMIYPGVYSWEGVSGTYLVRIGEKTFRLIRN